MMQIRGTIEYKSDMAESENPESFPPPTPDAAIATVRAFLQLAADHNDPVGARALMTEESNTIPAFDPHGLYGMKYLIADPILDGDAVIVPVQFTDQTGQCAAMPIVVILDNDVPKLDIASTMELMLGAEINYVDGIPDEEEK